LWLCVPRSEDIACDNTYMSVQTRIWIQKVIKIFIFSELSDGLSQTEALRERIRQLAGLE